MLHTFPLLSSLQLQNLDPVLASPLIYSGQLSREDYELLLAHSSGTSEHKYTYLYSSLILLDPGFNFSHTPHRRCSALLPQHPGTPGATLSLAVDVSDTVTSNSKKIGLDGILWHSFLRNSRPPRPGIPRLTAYSSVWHFRFLLD